MAEIELKNVSYLYGKKTPFEKLALDNVSVKFEKNAVTGLIGHTGCGKSTLVQLLNGLLTPTTGQVLFDGEDINKKGYDKKTLRNKVGLVFQYPEYQLFEETVADDIAFGPKNMGLSDEEIRRRVNEAVRFVDLDFSVLSQSPFDISGGQKRRAAIAGVMAMEPEVLILDEPAAGLDPIGREEILGGIRSFRKEKNGTVIIVSHSMEDMARYADYIAVMDHGKITATGRVDEIFGNAELLRSAGLDVPQITAFMLELKSRGVDINTSVFTVDDAVEQIKKYMAGRKKNA